LECVDRYLKNFSIGGLLHQGEVAGSLSFVPSYLEKNAELVMDIRERPGQDLGADAVQVEEVFVAGKFLDLIAQDQDVDAGENGAVSHGGAPLDTGGIGKKWSITPPDRVRNSALPAEEGRTESGRCVTGEPRNAVEVGVATGQVSNQLILHGGHDSPLGRRNPDLAPNGFSLGWR
jgi:hypothetical protein